MDSWLTVFPAEWRPLPRLQAARWCGVLSDPNADLKPGQKKRGSKFKFGKDKSLGIDKSFGDR